MILAKEKAIKVGDPIPFLYGLNVINKIREIGTDVIYWKSYEYWSPLLNFLKIWNKAIINTC